MAAKFKMEVKQDFFLKSIKSIFFSSLTYFHGTKKKENSK
jgi:hypothetical protein